MVGACERFKVSRCMVIFLIACALILLFSAVGCWVVSASSPGFEKHPLWSFTAGGWIESVSVSPDGSYIAAGSDDHKVYLFSRSDNAPLWSYATDSMILSVAVSENGSYVVTGGADDYKVHLFDNNGTLLWSYQTQGWVESVAISEDGSYIVAGSWDENIYLFSRDSSTPLWSYKTGGKVLSVAISEDGSYIAAGSDDGKVYLFSWESSTPLWSYATGNTVSSVAISGDGSDVAAGNAGGKIYLFSRDSSTPLWSYATGGYVESITISSDGLYIAAGSDDHKVYLFSRSDNAPLWSHATGGGVWSVDISENGSIVAAGSKDGRVYLFSRTSGTFLWSYPTGGQVYSVSVSSNGDTIAAGSWDSKVYLFGNTPPTLSSRGLSPTSGQAGATFTYEVIYTDADGDAPSYVKVYIDGSAKSMSYVSGTYAGGAVYRYSWTPTSADVGDNHTYYFEASDGVYTARLPGSGSYSGPDVAEKEQPSPQPSPDFTVSVRPLSGSIPAGGSSTASVAVSGTGGYGYVVNLSVSGQPSGVTVYLSQAAGVPSFNSTMTISVGENVPSGEYTITVTGTGGDGKVRTATYLLSITGAKPIPDFSISIEPSRATIHQGGSTTAMVTLTASGGFDNLVRLTASGLPSGVWVSFESDEGRVPFNSAMTISVGENVPVGDYTITVKGVVGESERTCSYVLSVNLFVSPNAVAAESPLIEIAAVAEGAQENIEFENMTINKIVLKAAREITSLGIKVQELIEVPSQVPAITEGVVYKYLNVVKENITDNDLSAVELQFGVERSWIEVNNIDDTMITLNRYSAGGWVPLPTERIGEDADYVFYSANSSGLSVFAVSGQSIVPSPYSAPASLVGILVVVACISVAIALVAIRKLKV